MEVKQIDAQALEVLRNLNVAAPTLILETAVNNIALDKMAIDFCYD